MYKRQVTNTPLQALVVLNDPQFVEAARAFAQNMIIKGGKDDVSRINYGFKVVLSRDATEEELSVIKNVLKNQITSFGSDKEKAKQFLSVGEFKRDESLDLVEHASWSVVAQILLNMDETLTRG